MYGPIQMPDDELQDKIEKSIYRLSPLFRISPDELSLFPRPRLRRELTEEELPKFNWQFTCYRYIDNELYFPRTSLWDNERSRNAFSPATINHEVSHYLHCQLNPGLNQSLAPFLVCPAYMYWISPIHALMESVAEYANFILNLNTDFTKKEKKTAYHNSLRVYEQQGTTFLPKLARMNLEEAIAFGILEGKNSDIAI